MIPLPMKFSTAMKLAVVLSIVVSAGGLAFAEFYEPRELDEEAAEQAVIEAINEERADHGMQPLSTSAELSELASYHSDRMVDLDFYGHTAPDGESVGDRLPCRHGSENLNKVPFRQQFDDPSGETFISMDAAEVGNDTTQMWMNSASHEENILDESLSNIGVGVSVDDDGEIHITAKFC